MKKEKAIETLKKIFENYSDIIGIRINGVYYHVDCTNTDIICNYDLTDKEELKEVLERDYDELLYTYQLDNDNFYEDSSFTIEDIMKAKDVILYRLEKI